MSAMESKNRVKMRTRLMDVPIAIVTSLCRTCHYKNELSAKFKFQIIRNERNCKELTKKLFQLS